MDKTWKVIFAFVGVFIAGAVFGGLLALRIGGRFTQMQAQQVRLRGPNAVLADPKQRPLLGGVQPIQPAQIMRRYADRLGFTPEQRKKIRPLIARATQDVRRQQQNNFRESNVILQRLQQDIARELTPEQREKLHKLEQRQREIASENRARFGDRGAPAGEGGRRRMRSGKGKAPSDGVGTPRPENVPQP